MSILPKPQVNAPAQAAPLPMAGADELKLGGGAAPNLPSRGQTGRLKLRTK